MIGRERMLELSVERGRLLERIARQRQELGGELAPLRTALVVTDRGVAQARAAAGFVRQHPSIVVATLTLFVALKPSRLWRWSRRAFFFWRSWRYLRTQANRIRGFRLSL